MRIVEVLALVVVAVGVGLLVLRLLQAEAARGDHWRVAERTEADGTVVVEVVRAGQHGRRVRELPPDLPSEQFDWDLAQARSDTEAQAAALNAGRPTRR